LNTHLNAFYLQTLWGLVGIGPPHEEATDAIAADSSAALGFRRSGRRYTSSQPLPDLEDRLAFPIQHDRRTPPYNGECPNTLSMGIEVPTGAMGLYRRIRHYRPPPLRGGGGAHNHQHYHLHRCSGDKRDPHHHAGGFGSHSHGPFHILYPQLDRHIHILPIQPPGH